MRHDESGAAGQAAAASPGLYEVAVSLLQRDAVDEVALGRATLEYVIGGNAQV